jgi:hypothetical protein
MHVVEFGLKIWNYHGKEIKEEVKGEKMGNKQKNSKNWATKLLWAKIVLGFDGKMDMVRC